MKRYAIWNKQDPIITPAGEMFTAEQWMARYPIAALSSVTVLCAPGEINGAIFATLGTVVQQYENEGCDFSACTTAEEKLQVIEDFEDAKRAEAAQKAEAARLEKEMRNISLASIAASMEYQNMLTLEDME